MIENFWAQVVGTYLAELTENAAEKVGKTLADLWKKRETQSSASLPELPAPFNAPPPLPLSTTPLFGRDAEFVEILKCLNESRLVTLTGVGGVGKTALAQTIALWFWETEREMQKNPRGVAYIALDALSSGRELAEYVRLRVVPDSQPPATDDVALRRDDAVRVISNALNRHARLVVLDNFESAMESDAGTSDAFAFLTPLIAATNSDIHFLVTSRIALNPQTDIETEYPVTPLEQKDALDLFYARAGDELRRNASTIADVSEICRMVDNLPLALELAARVFKIGHRPLSEIRQGLRVTLLNLEAADLRAYPERQRGLVASFRYTYNFLTPAAQRLFMLMHIFRGSADRNAIESVDGSVMWRDGLSELVNWKLVDEDRTRELWRYSMLATTEAFSRFQFTINPNEPRLDENEFRRRHAEYYVKVAARFNELPMERWREIKETDWENIKAGADWAVQELETREGATVEELLARIDELPTDAGEAGLAGEYAYQLVRFIFRRRTLEGRVWLGAGLVAFQRADNKKRNALMCNQLGLWCDSRGEYDKALGWYERDVKITEELGDTAVLAAAFNNIGSIHRARGAYDEALGWYERSVKIKEEIGDTAGLAATFNNIASIHYARGAYDDALRWYERSVKISEEIGDTAVLAAAFNNIGLIHKARGAYDKALGWYERDVKIFEEIGDTAGLAATFNNIGEIHRARGAYDKALGWYERSVKISEEIGDTAGLAATFNNIGSIHKARGAYDEALGWYERSVKINEEIGNAAVLATTFNNIGEIHRARGAYDKALGWYERSVKINQEIGNTAMVATTFNNIGAIHFTRKQYAESLKWLNKALEIQKQIGDRSGLAQGSFNAAMLALAMSNRTEAQTYARQSLRLYEELKLEKNAEQVRAWMKENGLE